jgi:phosphatidate cytidylyltransferase
MRLYTPPNLADATPPTTPVSSEAAAAIPAGPSNLRLRIIYGLIGAAMLLGSVWFSPWTFGLFFAAVQAVMLWEFYRMMRAGGYRPTADLLCALSLVLFGTLFILNNEALADTSLLPQTTSNPYTVQEAARHTVLAVGLLLPVTLICREMYAWTQEGQEPAPFSNVGVALLGLLYVTLPMSTLNILAFDANGYNPRRIFALLFLIWASDIGAYAAGKTFGKHKMAPQISPGKTWEGWAGGFVLTLVVGWAVGFMLPDMPLAHRLVAAGVVAVFAPLGDLAESMLKRSVGVKDSGSIMPGHGGLLDRFDAFLLVLPVLALLQLLAG